VIFNVAQRTRRVVAGLMAVAVVGTGVAGAIAGATASPGTAAPTVTAPTAAAPKAAPKTPPKAGTTASSHTGGVVPGK
jgi:hypothetical protein